MRQILHRGPDARNAARELLQGVFASELLAPSERLWIVSPWLRDIPIIDNRTDGFAALNADLPRTTIRLSRVLRALLDRGTRVVIATRPELSSREVIEAIGATGPIDHLRYEERAEMHVKGIVGDSIAIVGSMNFTHNGLDRLTEMLIFHTDPARVAEIRLEFGREYGGLT